MYACMCETIQERQAARKAAKREKAKRVRARLVKAKRQAAAEEKAKEKARKRKMFAQRVRTVPYRTYVHTRCMYDTTTIVIGGGFHSLGWLFFVI